MGHVAAVASTVTKVTRKAHANGLTDIARHADIGTKRKKSHDNDIVYQQCQQKYFHEVHYAASFLAASSFVRCDASIFFFSQILKAINRLNTKNPPGGRMKKRIGWYEDGII
jgi:hypothetical protein